MGNILKKSNQGKPDNVDLNIGISVGIGGKGRRLPLGLWGYTFYGQLGLGDSTQRHSQAKLNVFKALRTVVIPLW